MKNTYLPIGCYCDGSCRSEANVVNYCKEILLESLNPSVAWYQPNPSDKIKLLIDEIIAALESERSSDCDNCYSELIDDACNLLLEYCAPYTSIGWNDGDFGCYVYLDGHDLKHNFDGLVVNDTSEVPDDYTGEVLHVNDHGNMTLYIAVMGQLTEIWGI